MFCNKCGKQLPDNAKFCNACGAKCVNFDNTGRQEHIEQKPINSRQESIYYKSEQNSSLECPACHSRQCRPVLKTQVSGGYSGIRGCCGLALFGPLGLLCGSSSVKSKNQTWWNCLSCGKEFITRDAALSKMKSGVPMSVLYSLICSFFAGSYLSSEDLSLAIIPVAIAAFIWYSLIAGSAQDACLSVKELFDDAGYRKLTTVYIPIGLVLFLLVTFLFAAGLSAGLNDYQYYY